MALTRIEQLTGQRHLMAMYRLNPLGANLLMGQVIFLFALDLGAGDLAMGLLYAGAWLSGAAAFAAPALCARIDPARITGTTWLWRSLLCLCYLLLPLLPAAWAVPAVVVLFLAFMTCRTIGVSAVNIATAAYAGPGELTPLIATTHLWWHIQTFVITVVSTAVLALWSGHAAYLALIALGVALSLWSSSHLRHLPPVGLTRPEALRHALPAVLRDPGVRAVLLATLLVVPQAVAAAYQLNVLRGALGLPADRITALTLGGILLSVAAIRLLGLLLPRTGLRPVQLATHLLLALIGLAWAFAGLVPAEWRTAWCVGLYVVAQALLAVSTAILAALQVDRLPARSPVAATALYQVVGAAAGVLGITLVWLIGRTGCDALPGAGPYAHAFVVWAACSAGVCLVGLATGGTAQVLADLRLLSPANLLGLLNIRR